MLLHKTTQPCTTQAESPAQQETTQCSDSKQAHGHTDQGEWSQLNKQHVKW